MDIIFDENLNMNLIFELIEIINPINEKFKLDINFDDYVNNHDYYEKYYLIFILDQGENFQNLI